MFVAIVMSSAQSDYFPAFHQISKIFFKKKTLLLVVLFHSFVMELKADYTEFLGSISSFSIMASA